MRCGPRAAAPELHLTLNYNPNQFCGHNGHISRAPQPREARAPVPDSRRSAGQREPVPLPISCGPGGRRPRASDGSGGAHVRPPGDSAARTAGEGTACCEPRAPRKQLRGPFPLRWPDTPHPSPVPSALTAPQSLSRRDASTSGIENPGVGRRVSVSSGPNTAPDGGVGGRRRGLRSSCSGAERSGLRVPALPCVGDLLPGSQKVLVSSFKGSTSTASLQPNHVQRPPLQIPHVAGRASECGLEGTRTLSPSCPLAGSFCVRNSLCVFDALGPEVARRCCCCCREQDVPVTP